MFERLESRLQLESNPVIFFISAGIILVFIARISKGRTIREFVTGVLLLPTMFSLIWYTVFGISAMDIELNGAGGLVAQVNKEVAVALFVLLEHFPFAVVTSAIGVLLVVIFFTTSSDSASLVIDMLTSGGNPNPPTRQRGLVQYSDHVRGQGPDFIEEACGLGLEGMVCKRADAPYRAGRTRHWLKVSGSPISPGRRRPTTTTRLEQV